MLCIICYTTDGEKYAQTSRQKEKNILSLHTTRSLTNSQAFWLSNIGSYFHLYSIQVIVVTKFWYTKYNKINVDLINYKNN